MNTPPPIVFDRALYARRRARAARTLAASDFLHRRVMADIVDRLESVTRDFPRALFYGADPFLSMLTPACGVGDIFSADFAASRLGHAPAVVCDEEAPPFANASFDLIVSILTLHATNDPVGALIGARKALKPDGLLIAALFGEETLSLLRGALYAAESECAGGVSPRVAPFAAVRDLGGALQRAGFALPVADLDRVRISYRDPAALFRDLKNMGETNALASRARNLRRDALAIAASQLAQAGEIAFDIVTLTGWAPHDSQPKPLARGSAKRSLKDALGSGRI